jgi:putative ABC transport system permease protein
MSFISRFLNQWRTRALDDEFDEELRFHFDARVDANMRRGIPREDAEAEARRHLGSALRAREGMREARISGVVNGIAGDLRHGVRIFRRKPWLSAMVVATLSLGIGASAAMFSLLNAALFRPLPFQDPARLVAVSDALRGGGRGVAPPMIPELLDVRAASTTFEALSFFDTRDAQINGGAEPARVFAARIESAVLPMLGVRPALGRVFTNADALAGSQFAAILSDGLWRRNFGADPLVVGRSVNVNGLPHVIVGVLPPDFSIDYMTAEPVEIYLPYPMIPVYTSWSAEFVFERRVTAIGRIKRGVTVEQVSAELDTMSRRIVTEHPNVYRRMPQVREGREPYIIARDLRESIAEGSQSSALVLLSMAVVLVLLIACTNTAQFLLAQSLERRPEVAVRNALGAGRGRLVRQFLLESMLLAVTASILGVVQAIWLTQGFRSLMPPFTPLIGTIGVDLPVLAFTTGVAVFTTLVCGLVPAWRFSQTGLETRAVAGHARVRHVLIAVEVAISMVLLIGAGLLLRTLQELQRTPSGYEAADVTAMRIRGIGVGSSAQSGTLGGVYQQYLDRIAALPGIESAAVTSVALPNRAGSGFSVVGSGNSSTSRQDVASFQIISPGYFSVLRIPLKEGRSFLASDISGRLPVAIVNEELARRAWPGQSAIGRQITAGEGPRAATMTVVGVVGNVKTVFQAGDEPQIYASSLQQNEPSMLLLIRPAASTRLPLDAVKRAIWSVEPRQAVFSIRPMEELIAERTMLQRAVAALIGGFATLAFVMSITGIYAIVTYLTSRRVKEIALRRAIGARTYDVVSLLAGAAFRWTMAGVLAGAAGAVLGSGLLRATVPGVVALNTITVVVIGISYLAAVACAVCVPAVVAMRIDPAAALRAE